MAQKVIVVGNSLAVIIPKDSAAELGIKAGDSVSVSAHPRARSLTVRMREKGLDTLNPDVVVWTNAFIEKNRKLLERLADK